MTAVEKETPITLCAHSTRLDILLHADGAYVEFGVVAEAEGGPDIIVQTGWAHYADCALILTGMDGWPRLKLGHNEIRLGSFEDMRCVSEYLNLPMPAFDPARCKAPQGAPS